MTIAKKIVNALLFVTFLSCTSSGIKISDDFDHGSIGEMQELSPGFFSGSTKHWMKRDSIGDQYYWFYFEVDGFESQELTFQLNQLKGVYRNKPHLIYSEQTQPVFSYDQKQWHRIENVSYDTANNELEFSHHFDQSPVWIAYAQPYPYLRLQTFIDKVAQSEFVKVEQLAISNEERAIELLTVTDTSIPAERKKTVMLIALQHAGEDAGGFYIEGIVDFLISESEEAKAARRQFIFKLVPMMNPDGIVGGSTRYNMHMEDLNNIWLNPKKMQPEVAGVQQWTTDWLGNGNSIDLFVDVHNHTQFYTYNVLIFNDSSMNNLRTVMDKHWPVRLWHSEPKGSAHAYFYRLGIPSGSLELTQSFSEKGEYLDIKDYHFYGKQTVRGLLDYFASVE